ncbi:tetratricopeptide repeat protein [bacterium]|nr:tetratricopeptide repeat protein [bacterium]
MKVGAYELLSEIGRGGMGSVYRARSPDGREVAVKLLRGPLEDGTIERFERERRLLSGFGEREGFVPLLDAGSSSHGPFLVMPFLEGGTLRERLRRRKLAVDEAIALGRSLASALARAHERGVVHRDLKPENVLFTRDGEALLADLGLAKHFRGDTPDSGGSISLSRSGDLVGTVGYAAFEQMRDGKSAGPQADVFSLGAILYECLAGEPAFSGPTIVELVERVHRGSFEPVRHLRPDAPAWLASVIERSLSRDPERRFEDGARLERALAGPSRSRRMLLPGLALGLVAGLSLAAAFFLKDRLAGSSRAATDLADTVVRAEQKLAKGDLDGASGEVAHALDLDPASARALCVRADVRCRRGDLDGAIADATRALELDRRVATAWSARGVARFQRGENDLAIADLSRALELEPRNAAAWNNRAVARVRKGDMEGARADVERALAIEPRNVGALANRGFIRTSRGELDAAIEDLKRALEIDPKSGSAWRYLGTAQVKKGELDLAIAHMTRAIEIDPRDGISYTNRANARAIKDDFQGAIADYTKALEIDPRNVTACSNRGGARVKLNDLAGGLADFTRAIELDPKLWNGFAARGDMLALKGDVERARADYLRFLELAPDRREAPRIRDWLEKNPPK